jgi:polysaccharide pyruvyl transferase WcaK-like protein
MGNIGDEGTLCGFARLLALHNVHPHVTVASRNPHHDSHVEPVFSYYSTQGTDPRRWWAKFRATAHAVIGGTAIMDILGDWPLCDVAPLVRSSERRKLPFVFIGTGVEQLRSSASQRIVREELAPRVQHWSVRSDRDRERLIGYGVLPNAVTTAADLAWLIEAVSSDFGRDCLDRLGRPSARPLIGVNLSNENLCFDRYPEMAAALADTLDTLAVECEARILFFCSEVREGEEYDKAATRRILDRMRHPENALILPNEYYSPRELMSLIDCCQLIVSMRYHVCLFSALQGVPFIAIERADKVADLCWDLDWRARLKPPNFTHTELLDHARRLIDGCGTSVRHVKLRHLQQRVAVMKSRATANMITLQALGIVTSPIVPAIMRGDHR